MPLAETTGQQQADTGETRRIKTPITATCRPQLAAQAKQDALKYLSLKQSANNRLTLVKQDALKYPSLKQSANNRLTLVKQDALKYPSLKQPASAPTTGIRHT